MEPPSTDSRLQTPPSALFTQILALVLATVVVSQILSLTLRMIIPPDPPRTIRLEQLENALRTGRSQALTLRIVPSAPLADSQTGSNLQVATILAHALGRPAADVRFKAVQDDGQIVGHVGDTPESFDPVLIGEFELAVRHNGAWLLIEPAHDGLLDTREKRLLFLIILSALMMLPVAYLFARTLARPFEQFADAAETIGRDPRADATPMVTGPAEVERAAVAFSLMQQRLQSYVADRTQMLSAIAHDLRTPLTRMAFRVEALPTGQREALAADVAEMNAMLKATLGLARMEHQPLNRQKLELGSLVEKVADDLAEAGHSTTATVDDGVLVEGDAVSLRRLFDNLMLNACHYGQRATAHVYADGTLAVIDIDDEGAGLSAEEKTRVFAPFYRVEHSRNRHTGGTGLGLTVARSMARAHGGDVILLDGPQGGLRARVTLPRISA